MATANAGIKTRCRVRLGDMKQKQVTTQMCKEAGLSKKERLGVVEFWDENTIDGDPLFVCSIIDLNGSTFAFRYNPEYWGGL